MQGFKGCSTEVAAVQSDHRRTRFRADDGSVLPILLAVVLLAFVLLMVGLASAAMAREKTRRQASAEFTALAGAGSLAKATETVRIIDFSIWSRNMTLDAMYLAATVATIGTAGAGVEAFAVPLRFQRATIRPLESLEKAREVTRELAVVHALANSAAISEANSPGDKGIAVPVPLFVKQVGVSQRAQDLKNMIDSYDARIRQAKDELDETLRQRTELREVLDETRQSSAEIETNEEMVHVQRQVRERSGRVGGLTTQRNRRRKELAGLQASTPLTVGSKGVISVVWHRDKQIDFTALFGGLRTGNSVSFAGAQVLDAPPTVIIGERMIDETLSGHGAGRGVADGLSWLLESINLMGSKGRSLKKDYGVIGAFMQGALDKIGIIPPPINEVRPSLVDPEKVIGNRSKLLDLAKKALPLLGRVGSSAAKGPGGIPSAAAAP